MSLWDSVRRGDIALVDGFYIVNLSKTGGELPCRQELPPEGVIAVVPDDARAADYF